MGTLMDRFTERTRGVLGDGAMERIAQAKVVVVGLGGVGSYAAETVVRAGVGHVTLVDHDTVDITNLNRQLCALRSTVGRAKADVCRERGLDINPDADIRAMRVFCDETTLEDILSGDPDCVLDCIDTVGPKVALIEACTKRGIRIFSALGTGRKLDPTRLCVRDVYETKGDPLARVVRHELRRRGVEHLTVVCSEEEPTGILIPGERKAAPGSVAWVPGCAGLILGSLAVRSIAEGAAPCGR
ncbi:MAG: tRNA threonylcarbamoyladenosine dehydratase [Clostridiaceae bacterium]|nr:tRNA threonylcarbamoyladenosine dehydratase [Clostridiaceae bacterium]